MHGLIYTQLKKYVETKYDAATWTALLANAGLGDQFYVPTQHYPDEEAVALVTTAASMTGLPAAAILEDFGEFIAPQLVSLYRLSIKPEWKTLDLIENTEHTIHRLVRVHNAGAAPPVLQCSRPSSSEVVIRYASARKMCAVAKGIAKGIARHYDEQVAISESTCMHKGGSCCTISVKLAA